jgi:putative ABC transport system permease protein
VACFDLFPSTFKNPDISLFVVDGVILTVSAVILVSRHQEMIGHGVRTVGGGSKSMSLRLGLAYPLARRFRTSIILLTFALTMFTLTSITLFSGSFGSQVDAFTKKSSGGFDVQAFSNESNPAPPQAVAAEPGVEAVAALSTLGAQFNLPKRDTVPGQQDFQFWGLAGFDQGFTDRGAPSLGKFLPRFADANAAWRGVLADPSLIIVNDFFLQNGGGPPEASVSLNEPVFVRDPVSGLTRELRIAGISDGGFGGGGRGGMAYMGIDGVRAVVGNRAVPNLLFIATKPGADPQKVAEHLNGRYLANGVDAISFRKLVSDGLAQQQQFFGLMQGYLALGLIVGVAGLGVVMVRAVRERRREIGVLRSLGFETRQVRRAFVAESTFVGLEGILIGTILAMVSTWRLLSSGAFGDGIVFSIPWGQVTAVVSLAFVATLIATASPAQQASKIRPAVALRIAD